MRSDAAAESTGAGMNLLHGRMLLLMKDPVLSVYQALAVHLSMLQLLQVVAG